MLTHNRCLAPLPSLAPLISCLPARLPVYLPADFAVAVPDICPEPANGCREQDVLFRFQQMECAGPAPEYKPPCKLVGWPMYWDSYWFSRFPGANASDTQAQTLITGPVNAASSSTFYATLLRSRSWWEDELASALPVISLPASRAPNH